MVYGRSEWDRRAEGQDREGEEGEGEVNLA